MDANFEGKNCYEHVLDANFEGDRELIKLEGGKTNPSYGKQTKPLAKSERNAINRSKLTSLSTLGSKEIGRLWKFDGYHDSLGEVGVGRFVIWPHKNMFIVPGCLVFSFKEYIKTSLGD
ncbi:hypothetical protein QJS10_CPB22g00018 [Acorus calamus]|uniref:Uncharacterized protein n=1 Tax=Acorus calamus TaxID=4465 RepID=A0AAV9C2L8_ACOCL|nr:hypothetical protein QJS10_CPB22g00018 [Acorus calamus]